MQIGQTWLRFVYRVMIPGFPYHAVVAEWSALMIVMMVIVVVVVVVVVVVSRPKTCSVRITQQ